MLPNLTFTDALNEFCRQAADKKYLTPGSINSYKSYLNTLDSATGNQTIDWVKDAISQSSDYSTCINIIKQTFDSFNQSNPAAIPVGHKSKLKSALVSFTTFIFGYFNAEAAILWGGIINEVQLAQLVADTAIFATLETVKAVKAGHIGRKENIGKGNPYASWDCMTSIRDSKNRGMIINNLYCDDNTRANQAIKRAVLDGLKWGKNAQLSYFKGFEACHIYDCVKNPNYYTSIMNLVLVPRALAALTDHNDYVKKVLKYHVYLLFGFYVGSTPPAAPKGYQNINWR